MDFDKNAINFFRTYLNFVKTYPPKKPNTVQRPSNGGFGTPILKMAESVIGSRFSEVEAVGVKSCLNYLIETIEIEDKCWWLFQTYRYRFDFNTSTISLLSDSIILNIVLYRNELYERHTNLSAHILNQMTYGFELVCNWIYHCTPITPNENDLIVCCDVEHLKQFIYKQEATP